MNIAQKNSCRSKQHQDNGSRGIEKRPIFKPKITSIIHSSFILLFIL